MVNLLKRNNVKKNKEKGSKYKRKSGISLIVLVITIIIMIILAATIIVVLTNDNVITKSKTAATDYNLKQVQEAAQVIYSDYLLDKTVADDYASTGEYIKQQLINEGVIKSGDENNFVVSNDGTITDVTEEVAAADLIIDSIEDLVTLSNSVSSGNSYSGETIVLTKTLDFTKTSSYEDSTSTSFGDINGNGTVETLINELTNTTSGCTGFKPIGTLNPTIYMFSGTFDGLNNEVLGIYEYIDSGVNPAGLFGITKDATIKNLGVDGTISGYYNVGGIIGVTNGSTTIYNCHNKATLTYLVVSTSYTGAIGGIVGRFYQGTIDSCYNEGNIYIYADESNCLSGGGIAGCGSSSKSITIVNSYNVGNMYRNVNDIGGSYRGFGGILGSDAIAASAEAARIYNSYNLGNVINTDCTNLISTSGILGIVTLSDIVDVKNVYNGIDFANESIEQIMGNPNSREYDLENAYYLSTGTNNIAEATSKTLSEIKSNEFVNLLNSNVATYNSANPTATKWKTWKIGSNGYPTLSY